MGARLVMMSVLLAACGSAPSSPRPESFLHVGVAPREEASLRAQLEAAGWTLVREAETPRFVALAFVRGEDERAVRVVSARGIVAALDSHEADGVRPRHGLVTLADPALRDFDGDGTEELVLLREGGPTPCLAVIRFDDAGDARTALDDAAALREGACVARHEDVDGDGTLEAIVPLSWPELSLADPPATVEVALVAREGGWHADGMPTRYVAQLREAQGAALEAARAARDVPRAATVGVALAALAHLTGASVAAQVERFDAALAGLVLTDAERDEVAAIRAVIASGWREPEP